MEGKIEEVVTKVRGYSPKEANGEKLLVPPILNGIISSSVRLAIATYNIMVKYGVSHTSVFESIWMIVEAVNELAEMKIEYPSDVECQKKIAKGFCEASKVKFDCCAGAIDGVLIWMHKPSLKEANAAGVGQKKFLCGRKNKFGLNCQAVCDV